MDTRALILLCSGLLLAGPAVRGASADRPDFNREIRPILSDNCFACHGPDDSTRKARLRLDRREGATEPSRSGALAIVPGDPDSSELIARITATDPGEVMPPPETGKSLTPEQVDVLRRWIASGADYQTHWAFVPPRRPPVPEPPADVLEAPISNPIDAFIAARLAQEGLRMSPEADRATLIRRVTLDLTGLPPSPEEVDAFLADPSPTAYEDLVDRLLTSPRYGERMALEWLDAARFADTHGYHLDSGRDMTAWRDWVIAAFNSNKPFDAFTVEQLAGDLLPDPTRDQLIATGFNRNHMINYEGGAIPEEYHYAYLVDRVNTTATVWLGLTMACAQCHDHKYDPISIAEYYQFLAFFNNVPEQGLDGNRGNAAPVLKLPTPEQEVRLAALTSAVEDAEKNLQSRLPDIDAAQAAWEQQVLSSQTATWTRITPETLAAAGGAEFTALDDGSTLVSGANPERDRYEITFRNPLERLTALRLEILPDPSLPASGPGRAHNGNIALTAVRLASGEREIRLASASASYSQRNFPIGNAIDDDPRSAWAVDGGIGKPHTAVFELEAPITEESLTLELRFESPFANHGIGRFRLAATDSDQPHDTHSIPEEIRRVLATAANERSDEDARRLRRFYRENVSEEHRRLRAAVDSARKARDEFDATIPTTMVMQEMATPRDTFIHLRGQYDSHGDKVTAGTPAFLPPLPEGEPVNRLGLARWLVSDDHPLTARVTVNRYWQMYFGHGLVKTSEDFGSQAEWPSHPELLDWLAREFIESGWDIRHMQRLIVTSATYRQSSRVTPDLVARDPENRLLARGPRLRLQAEFIRDQALAISGLLNDRIGGESVSPYQPAGLWSELSMREDSERFSAQFFVQSKGADLYRRSMYTFWKRSSPPPQLSTFDAPDRETCTVKRPRTNTPLQALILLNDPTYIEASRKLAERLLARPSSDAARVAWAFRLATARHPTAREQTILLRVLQEQRAHYRTRREAAEALLSHGDSPRDPTWDPTELAAWTMLSSTILNLDETITKG